MYSRLLYTFIIVADCGSFSKAAEKLYISSTAVMKQMNLFEEEMGVTVLRRTTHGIVLTEAGKIIYKDAKYIIDFCENTKIKAQNAMNNEQYTIRVGTSILNPCKRLMDLWSKVNDIYPQFKIKIIPFDDDNQNILSTLSSKIGQNIDFIVAACDSIEWTKRCQFYQLGTYNVCIAVPRNHKLAKKDLITIDDLSSETIIMSKAGDSPILGNVRDFITKKNPEIKIEDTHYYYDINVFNFCEESQSILLTLDGWADIHPSLKTIPIEWDYVMPYGLLYSQMPSKDVLTFLDIIKDLII